MEQRQLFDHLVAILFYLRQWTRQDIQTAIVVLYTKVREPDTDHCKKPGSVMLVHQGHQKLALNIEQP